MTTHTTTVRPDVLARYGRRAARLIADAEKGADLTASILYLRYPEDELDRLVDAGALMGGVDEHGNLAPYRCAV